jgi:hypothetical protein
LPGAPSDYEEDQLISLELGVTLPTPKPLVRTLGEKGQQVRRIWLGAETKDRTEDYTYKLVCPGQMSLADAQSRIASDWHCLWEDEGRP